jgi:urease accessory protein
MMDSIQTIGMNVHRPSQPGVGTIELAAVAGRTAVTRCRANSPLRLLTPQNDSPVARVVVGSYGGGLVGGDAIDLTVDAGAGTRCLLCTQASTKIYRSAGAGCSQHLKVSAEDEAIIASLPDPVVCFAGSSFSQRQQFDLVASASLIMLDWFTSGRAARGERWAMRRYASQTEVTVAGECVFRDSLELDPSDGEIGGAMRMGRIDCFATVVLVGPAIADRAAAMVDHIQRQSIAGGETLLFGASQLTGAVVLRVSGKSSEAVGACLREKLAFISDLLGMDPWQRKW